MAKKDSATEADTTTEEPVEVELVAFQVQRTDVTSIGLPSGEYAVVDGVVSIHPDHADFLASLGYLRA